MLPFFRMAMVIVFLLEKNIKMKKLAALSNINIDPLKSFLNKNDLDFYFAGYNQWQSELTNPTSGLYNFNPDYVFLHLDAEELKNQTNDVFSAIEYFVAAFPKIQFIISNFSLSPYSVDSYINNAKIETDSLNNALISFQNKYPGIFIFDFNRLIALYGFRNLISNKFWYLGRIKYNNAGFRVIADELQNVLQTIEGKTKKVLALDLDNTLWGGVAGEDGWNNLKISEEGIGKIYADFQRNIIKLANTGILLVIVSKNNETDAKEVFQRNQNMQLSWDDFVAKKINWNNKADNLREIANELNLGLDSIVFIDDNAFERELVKESLPEIIVPDFPEDITELNYWFINNVIYPNFAKSKISNEDLNKTEQYKRNSERVKESILYSYEEFLKQLNINLDIKYIDNENVNRISQLTQKTNQFNLNGKKYSESDLIEMMHSDEFKLFSLQYSDKFGNEGITGVAILKLSDDTAFLDVFLLSCRILGRNIEHSFINYLTELLQNINVKFLKATFVDNGRNIQVREFLIKYGFITNDHQHFILKIG